MLVNTPETVFAQNSEIVCAIYADESIFRRITILWAPKLEHLN